MYKPHTPGKDYRLPEAVIAEHRALHAAMTAQQHRRQRTKHRTTESLLHRLVISKAFRSRTFGITEFRTEKSRL
jgi:hypothetical protein